jgi:hypothetical protein
MTPKNMENTVSGLFAKHTSRYAMFLVGSYAASISFGLPTPDMLPMLADTFFTAIGHVPFAPTLDAMQTFFDGALHWAGGTALSFYDQITALGGEVGHRSMEVLGHIRNYLGDNADLAKTYVADKVTQFGETARIWHTTVTNSVFKDTGSLLSAAKDGLVNVIELWGVCEGLSKAYKWGTKKLFGAKAKEAEQKGEEFSASSTNVNLNITLNASVDGDVEKALTKLSEKISENVINPETVKKCGCLARDETTETCDYDRQKNIIDKYIADSDEVIHLSREINRRIRDEFARNLARSGEPKPREFYAELNSLLDRKLKHDRYVAITNRGRIVKSLSDAQPGIDHDIGELPLAKTMKQDEAHDAGPSIN